MVFIKHEPSQLKIFVEIMLYKKELKWLNIQLGEKELKINMIAAFHSWKEFFWAARKPYLETRGRRIVIQISA